jgi:diguanylate cyclase (GGDEF)-like protein/PAS domain S-box-containing protein
VKTTGAPAPSTTARKAARVNTLLPVVLIIGVGTLLTILLLYISLAAQSAVRGYVAGESYWSKSLIDAVYTLQMYGKTKDAAYFERHQATLKVPMIDREVRIEMQKSNSDYQRAAQGMRAGGIDPQEIPGMISLFRCCANTVLMRKVIEPWEQADPYLLQLEQLGLDLKKEITSGAANQNLIDQYVQDVSKINESIRPLAYRFNSALGSAAREITFLIFIFASAILLGIVLAGVLLAFRFLARIRQSETQLRALLNSADDGTVVVDEQSGAILDLNPRATTMMGLDTGYATGIQFDQLIARTNSNHVRSESALPQQIVFENKRSPQRIIAEINYSSAVWNGQKAHLAIIRDITDRITSEKNLHIANKALANLAEGVMILDERLRIVSVNRAFRKITGYEESEVIGLYPPLPVSRWSDLRMYLTVCRQLRKTGAWRGEILNRRKNGEYYSELHRASCVQNEDGKVTHFVCVFNDNTAMRESERKLKFLAQRDSLTQLLNRSKFEEMMAETLQTSEQTGSKAALLFIDLDNFKTINDTFGHAVGDEYLKKMSARIASVLRSTDLIGRVGGDEFAVLLANVRSRADVVVVATKLRNIIAQQVNFEGSEVSGSASVGLCLYPDDAKSVEELFVYADAAMYEAKRRGRNNLQWFSRELMSTVETKLVLASGLRVAAERGQLELHYQPSVDLRTGVVRGLEALLRWTHPDFGRVSPAVFIPLAEEFGMIDGLTDFVLREACRQGRAWMDAGIKSVPISVNLSPRNFWDAELSHKIKTIIDESGWPAKYLRLEITESTIMGGENPTAVMQQLRELGLSLSIDDFGVGHSSLSNLKNFPVQCMKIDLSFVRGIPENKTNLTIIKTIISLATHLELELIAEGIETQIQADTLLQEGCVQGQGYFYCKPAPAAQIESYLRENDRKNKVPLLDVA